MRAGAALFLCLIPGFGLSFLLALGERDWFHCYAFIGQTRPDIPSLLIWDELRQVLLETVTPPFGDPYLFLLHFAPGLAFGALWLTRPQRALVLGWAIFVALCLIWLLPVATQHDCDPKGTEGVFALFLLAPIGVLIAFAAHYLSKFRRRFHD